MKKVKLNLFVILLLLTIGVSSSCHEKKKTKVKDTANLPRTEVSARLNDSITHLLSEAKADTMDIHSIMVVQDGNVIFEKWINGGNANKPHILNSVSKTLTSIAIGMAIEEGKIKLCDKLISFFPKELPSYISDNLAAITIRDLLTMTCGHAFDHTYEMQKLAEENSSMDWIKHFLSYPVDFKPGEVYCYNSVGTFMLSAIIQKVTREKLIDYLNRRLFIPLQIKNVYWTENNQGINYGGWGLYLKTEDLAKVGQLLLQKGKWNDKQLIPEIWVTEMSKKQVDSAPAGINATQLMTETADPDWIQGYGYQMWRCCNNAFRADGAMGQYILVLPEQNAVIAITANTNKMQKELELVWKYILPILNN